MQNKLETGIRLGDEHSFELFFRLHYVGLCLYANKFLNNPEKVEEIVQNAFAEIWEGRDEFNNEDSLKSHIFKIILNDCLNTLKKERLEMGFSEIFELVYSDHRKCSVQ